MTKVVYKIVKHEDGWAYKARGTFSETFPSHDAALAAAKRAAGEQRVPGETVGIEYETKDGAWHEELDPGSDRPQTEVEDEDEEYGARELFLGGVAAPALASTAITCACCTSPGQRNMQVTAHNPTGATRWRASASPTRPSCSGLANLNSVEGIASIAALLYFGLWFELLDEMHIRQAAWS